MLKGSQDPGKCWLNDVPLSATLAQHFVFCWGGGEVLALEMGRGVTPACLKPGPVAIRLTGEKIACPNFENNTEFNRLAYGVITTNILHVL